MRMDDKMAEVIEELKYTENHEWIKVDAEEITYGISDYAQEEMGDIVYVELPMENDDVKKGDVIGVVESVKTVSDLFAPISGTITAINEELEASPELINEDPFGEGWIAKIQIEDNDELNDLLSSEEYKKDLD